MPGAIGSYFSDLAQMAARTEASGGDAMAEWLRGWTVFYWAWWISWTPFVGVFIARISRGRTIRQFVTGVLLVPSVVTLMWFAIFGGAGHRRAAGRRGRRRAGRPPRGSCSGVLEQYPLATVMTVLVMVLVAIFFVSGADAASIVMGSLSERGTLAPEPPRRSIFWGVVMGAVAAVMLLIGGDEALTGLQNLTIIAALPFALVMVGLAVSLAKDVRSDPLVLRRTAATEAVEQAVVEGITAARGRLRARGGGRPGSEVVRARPGGTDPLPTAGARGGVRGPPAPREGVRPHEGTAARTLGAAGCAGRPGCRDWHGRWPSCSRSRSPTTRTTPRSARSSPCTRRSPTPRRRPGGPSSPSCWASPSRSAVHELTIPLPGALTIALIVALAIGVEQWRALREHASWVSFAAVLMLTVGTADPGEYAAALRRPDAARARRSGCW